MATFSMIDVQDAVHSVLSADSTLLSFLGNGVDSITDNTGLDDSELQMPYIVYSGLTSQSYDTKNTTGNETYITLSVFSNTGEKRTVSDIMERVKILLHRQDLTVAGNDFILCNLDGLYEIFIDDTEDFINVQGVMRFKVLTSEN